MLASRPSLYSFVALLLTAFLGVGTASPVQAQDEIIELEVAFPNVTFDMPLGIRYADDGSDRLYIAEFGGKVKVLENDPAIQEATVFLDLSDRIATDPSGEFFAIEFHPDYAENGYFFVRYKLQNPHRTILSRFERSASNPLEADPESEVILFEIETPNNTNNHHGGDLAFGPDGYLYVPLGDGGVTFDAVGNAQDRTKLLGKVLRLDIDNPDGGLNYGIPPDNPFVGNEQNWREEIYAYGFRNPWRLTVDRATGDVWVGDVGESAWEEVDLLEAGQNYGWPIMEGPVCAPFGPDDCDQTGLTLPVWAYPHTTGTSITGGYVYRGTAIPVLRGMYVYADYTGKQIWAVGTDAPTEAELLSDPRFNITTFGEDPDGELYLTNFFSGKIFKIIPGPGGTATEGAASELKTSMGVPYPNPARDEASIVFQPAESAHARLTLYDLLGREVMTLFDGYVPAQTQQRVRLSTRDLASGVYVCRLESGDDVVVQRLHVTR